MKIAFFTHRYPVTSEAFIINAATGLLRAGHDVDVYALFGEGDAVPSHLPANDRYRGRFRRFVFRLRETPRRRLALAPLVGAQLFARHGVHCLRAMDRRRFGPDGPSLVALHEAGLFREQWRYDVLHCQFGTLAEPVLNHRDAGFISGRAFVHFRGFDVSSHLKDRQTYQSVFRRADGFFTNCDHFRRRLIEHGAPSERTAIIPSAVDTDLFTFSPRKWLPGERLRLLCVGRLVEKKGVRYALEAVAGLTADGVDVECRVIGAGPLRAELQAHVAKLNIAGRVSFTGAAQQADVASALEAAHILLAPSTTASNGDEDGSINTLKEAMATGRPFVSTQHGGIPELVFGLDAGVLAPEKDASALRRGVHCLLRRLDEWPAMAARARTRIEREYSIEASTALTVAAYDRALAAKQNRRLAS